MSKSGGKRSGGCPEPPPAPLNSDRNREQHPPNRPSVFERLGTKKEAAARHWPKEPPARPGTHHQHLHPGKRDDKRLLSTVVVRDRDPDRPNADGAAGAGTSADWAAWARSLEHADADALEQRRQQLQRELDMQMKMESAKDRRDKRASSSSSSRTSSSTSVSSSSSGITTSSSSSARDARRKSRKIKSKRNSSSSSGSDRVSKRKHSKDNSLKRDKPNSCKNTTFKKDDRGLKKSDPPGLKKKILPKPIGKKSLSPAKKAGGTPPISNKNIPKGYILPKHRTSSKSPRKDRNRSSSPHTSKDRDKEKEKEREKERERERMKEREKEREKERDRDKDRDRDRDKDRNRKSKSPRSRPRSRSPVRRHSSHPPRDPRRKDSPTKSRGSSRSRSTRQDSDKHRGRGSPLRDDRKDDKRKDRDRSLERRKDKHDDKDRHDRDRKDRDQQRIDREAQREKEREEALARCQERQRERDRMKEQAKRDQDSKRNPNRGRDRDRGLNKGLEKPGPDKPVERLLPRPEERLAALAATKNLGLERAISSNRERSESRTERNSRKTDRSADRDRIDRLPKRQSDRRSSIDRPDRNEYSHSLDRSYDHSHSMDRNYDRPGERYDDLVSLDRERERSPGVYPLQGHERDLHYDSPYDLQGSHSRSYLDPDERAYGDHLDDHHVMERGFLDDRRSRECSRRDDLSWDGRETSIDPDRQYMHHNSLPHAHKDWDNEDYHADWNRQDRHWQHRDKGLDWVDKDRDIDGNWHSHRQVSGSNKGSRSRAHEEGGGGSYRNRLDHTRDQGALHSHPTSSKRNRDPPSDAPDTKKANTGNAQNSSTGSGQNLHTSIELENPPIPDDLSEISDDADEILNRDDELSEVTETAAVATDPPDTQNSVDHYGMIDLQPFKPDYEPMIEHVSSKSTSKQVNKEVNGQKSEPVVSSQKEGHVDNKTDQSQEHDGEDGLDNLDFEEISDGELEEDQRVKGLGDALGVDWASLVAEVRGKKDKDTSDEGEAKVKSGAREHWQPQKVLARIGVSLHLAGENMINEIFNNKPDNIKVEPEDSENHVNNTFKLSHPIASVQVAIERRRKQRLLLFGTENGYTRALCARQDLALRRHLCNLPVNECGHEIHPPEPHLFAMAQKLIQKHRVI